MIDPTKLDINKLPKKFVDGAIGSHGKEGFSFVLTSGTDLHSFMTTPTTMKSISEWMAKQIQNFEKQYGVIDMTPPAVVSPLQASDLGEKGK